MISLPPRLQNGSLQLQRLLKPFHTYLELTIKDTERDIDTLVKEMCEKVLTNVVIEDYRYEVEEAN